MKRLGTDRIFSISIYMSINGMITMHFTHVFTYHLTGEEVSF